MNKKIISFTLVSLGFLAGATALSALAQTSGTWTAPTALPPNGNVSAPINVGSASQSKTGLLGLANLLVTNLQVASGTPTAGSVLTSDSAGNAYWATGGSGSNVVLLPTDILLEDPNGVKNCGRGKANFSTINVTSATNATAAVPSYAKAIIVKGLLSFTNAQDGTTAYLYVNPYGGASTNQLLAAEASVSVVGGPAQLVSMDAAGTTIVPLGTNTSIACWYSGGNDAIGNPVVTAANLQIEGYIY